MSRSRDDVRFVLEVVSETDPWFEQGASANLFSSRFRNFVIARCRSQGLQLSAEELDLIDAWFGGSPMAQRAPLAAAQGRSPEQTQTPAYATQPGRQAAAPSPGDRWWSADEGRQYGAATQDDEMPLIVPEPHARLTRNEQFRWLMTRPGITRRGVSFFVPQRRSDLSHA